MSSPAAQAAATTEQPAVVPTMKEDGIFEKTAAAFDKNIEEIFAIGKEAFDSKGLIKSGNGDWKLPWYAFWNDCMTCCLSVCCGCYVYGQTRQALYSKKDWTGDAGVCCLCGPCYTIPTRTMIRKKYALKGSVFEDALLSACCGPCVLTQIHYEVFERENKVDHSF